MTVQALGYIGVRAKNLEDWAGYGQNFLGLQKIDKSRQTMAFRMDDRKQRLVVDADGGQASASSAGRWRTAQPSTTSPRVSKRWAPRSPAARARSPMSAM